ncbi:MAG: sugar phosphate isomerase/epimerase family protein [Mycobacteriales bacterium]
MTAVDVPSGRPAAATTPGPGDPRLRRLSLNQRTVRRWSALEAVEACARAGVPAVGLWREPVVEDGTGAVARAIERSGLRVSSLCRGGFFTASDAARRVDAAQDNRRAVDLAAELGAACLVLVVGGLPDGSPDLPAARARVADAVAELVGYAAPAGVRLAIEPMQPMYCADRSVLSTLAQALDLAGCFPADDVGVVIDSFHLWWDPALGGGIERAGNRIAGAQVSDWITPMAPDPLLSRGMIGDGHIDFGWFVRALDTAEYAGDLEVEIFNADVWDADPQQTLDTVLRRYAQHVETGAARSAMGAG